MLSNFNKSALHTTLSPYCKPLAVYGPSLRLNYVRVGFYISSFRFETSPQNAKLTIANFRPPKVLKTFSSWLLCQIV
ncbi:MAG: hypothetical protein ACTS4U_01490 [Candidatus Hodgkinia cicadicola]